MKTPEEIAHAQMRAFTVIDGDVEECSAEYIAEQIAEAIRADRAQRDNTIHAAVIAALRETAEAYDDATDSARAADALEDEPDEFWMRYGAPMLEQIEKEYGR